MNDIINLINNNDFDGAMDLIIDRADDLDDDAAQKIMTAVRALDPTFSGVGAEIRDTLRDNTDLTIF